jgi:hypothetical protein
MPHHVHQARVPEHVFHTKHDRIHLSGSDGPTITPINMIRSHGFMFTNFDGPNAGTVAGTGTNMNGIETLRELTISFPDASIITPKVGRI